MKTHSLLLALVSAVTVGSACGQSTSGSSEAAYIGRDGNWFNPSNWSTGRVPGAHDDVLLDAGDVVVIDPALGSAEVRIRDLIVQRGATLESRPGTLLQLRDELIEGSAQVSYRSSAVQGETLIAGDPTASGQCAGGAAIITQWCGVTLNPTPKSKRIIVLSSSVLLEMGLGGVRPASIRTGRDGRLGINAGAGHYATLSADSLSIDGQLWLNLHYGFRPLPGERYTLLSGGRSTRGQFIGLDEGALAACTAAGVGLFVSYRGGDGNDVELQARLADGAACEQDTVQPLRQWSAPTPEEAATREHILLARQVGVPVL